MKTLFLMLGLFIGINCYSQEYDTMKVLLMVCDTSEQYVLNDTWILDSITWKDDGGLSDTIYGHFIYDTVSLGYDNSIYWQYGYEVQEKYYHYPVQYYVNGDIDWYDHSYRHVKYLDSDKKELPENIILWNVKKEIK